MLMMAEQENSNLILLDTIIVAHISVKCNSLKQLFIERENLKQSVRRVRQNRPRSSLVLRKAPYGCMIPLLVLLITIREELPEDFECPVCGLDKTSSRRPPLRRKKSNPNEIP